MGVKSLMREIMDMEVWEKELAIFWLGQNSYVLKTENGTLIAIDPYFSRKTPRGIGVEDFFVHADPPVRPQEFTVDYVFCTHDHSDHTDRDSLSIVAENSPETIFFGPPESYNRFLEIGVPPARARSLREDVAVGIAYFKVTPLSSIVGTEKDDRGQRWTTHYGYVFDFGFVKLYNMGDSSPEVASDPEKVLRNVRRLSPEIAIFPIIGDFPGRKPEDAFVFARIVQPKIVIPSHYGCFKNRTVDPRIFVKMFEKEAGTTPVVIMYKDRYLYRAGD